MTMIRPEGDPLRIADLTIPEFSSRKKKVFKGSLAEREGRIMKKMESLINKVKRRNKNIGEISGSTGKVDF